MQQDEDTRSQLNRNFDAISSLLFTKEYIDAGFGIWDAGMSLSATIVTGSHARCFIRYLKILVFLMARAGVYKDLVPVHCILVCVSIYLHITYWC